MARCYDSPSKFMQLVYLKTLADRQIGEKEERTEDKGLLSSDMLWSKWSFFLSLRRATWMANCSKVQVGTVY